MTKRDHRGVDKIERTDKRALALAVGASMYGRDRASHGLGIKLDEIRPGYARMSMQVQDWMIQGYEICHGGLLFALADTAMAFAASSHNEQHIALHGNIDYLRPAKLGDTLTAEAHEGSRTNRTGMYNVIVENHTGDTLCYFRGRTYGVGGTVIRNDEES